MNDPHIKPRGATVIDLDAIDRLEEWVLEDHPKRGCELRCLAKDLVDVTNYGPDYVGSQRSICDVIEMSVDRTVLEHEWPSGHHITKADIDQLIDQVTQMAAADEAKAR